MTLPIKKNLYKYSNRWPKYIILHHTDELDLNNSATLFDRPSFQMNALVKSFYQLESRYLPYNFIIEKVGDEYHPIVSAPLLTKMPFLDLDDEYQEGIHVALMGNYHAMKPNNKLYDTLSLRVIIPMMRAFRIRENFIVKHSDVSLNPRVSCPGEFVDMAVLKSFIKKNMIRKSVQRR